MRGVVLLCLLHATFLQARAQFSWISPPTKAPRVNQAPAQGFHWNGGNGGGVTSAPKGACDINTHTCGCCVMVQQVKKMEEQFNTILTKLEEEHKSIARVLEHCNKSRVAFSASLHGNSGHKCQDSGSSNDYYPVTYKEVLFNLGNAYNANNGIFTAPSSGVYSVTVTVYSDSGRGTMDRSCATLQLNSTDVASVHDRHVDDPQDSATILVALHLKVGDTVAVQARQGCLVCGNGRYNTFSIFLLYSSD